MSAVDRVDHSSLVLGALSLVALPFFVDPSDVFIGVFAILAAVASAIAANHAVPRTPRLEVQYRNHEAHDRPIYWRARSDVAGSALHVYVCNRSKRASAEAVEARFDRLHANSVWNEAGNPVDPRYVDLSVTPVRFTSGDRILPPGEEWCVARLTWHIYGSEDPPPTATWRVWAKGARPKEGTVRIEVVDRSPEDKPPQ